MSRSNVFTTDTTLNSRAFVPACISEILITEKEIDDRVVQLAKEINKDYQNSNRDLVMICVLKGAFAFCADLARHLPALPVEIEFINLSSYGNNTYSSGEVKIEMPISNKNKLVGKDILIVEDIVDSGRTATFLMDYLQQFNPHSVRLVSLLRKLERLQFEVKVDYLGFDILDKFVVGRGLDYQGKYRTLPYIGVVNTSEK